MFGKVLNTPLQKKLNTNIDKNLFFIINCISLAEQSGVQLKSLLDIKGFVSYFYQILHLSDDNTRKSHLIYYLQLLLHFSFSISTSYSAPQANMFGTKVLRKFLNKHLNQREKLKKRHIMPPSWNHYKRYRPDQTQ